MWGAGICIPTRKEGAPGASHQHWKVGRGEITVWLWDLVSQNIGAES